MSLHPTAPSSERTVCRSPATGEVLGYSTLTSIDELEKCIVSARSAQKYWADLPVQKRVKHVLRVRDYISQHAEEIAEVIAKDNGKTRVDALSAEVMPAVMAHFWTVRSFLPEMIQANHGHLVTIASAGGWIGVNSLADYCASKFAAVGFDESIRMELRKKGLRGVKTTLVSPYYINTGMFKGVKSKYELILPILDEHFVARRIVRAVKNDCAVLKMPPMVYLLPLLRLLPVTLFDLLADILGISSTMDEFVGRQRQ